jgi:branched-chain amino acid transport system ATP-binding protein
VLKTEHLTVRYEKALVLDSINLTAAEGQLTAVVGPNGAGKTTLLNTISGLKRPESGSISYQDEPIHNSSPLEIVRKGIVQCPERHQLFGRMSVMENLEMGAYLHMNKRDAVKNDLERIFEIFPVLKERIDQMAGTLSGGEQQMLALARSLMSKPKFLMLDEPSVGLSPIAKERIFMAIEEIKKKEKITVLLAEQDASMALAVADRSYVLESGNITFSGTSAELERNDYIRSAYLVGV